MVNSVKQYFWMGNIFLFFCLSRERLERYPQINFYKLLYLNIKHKKIEVKKVIFSIEISKFTQRAGVYTVSQLAFNFCLS